MEPIHLTSREAILYVGLINAGVGLVLGLIPLGFGFFRNRKGLGLLAMAISIVGGGLLGAVFISLPTVVLFTWLILRNNPDADRVADRGDRSSDDLTD